MSFSYLIPMLLMEPSPTRFDLRWRMFGIDVRVHPMFWLVSLIMGADLARAGYQFLLIWIGCVFVSILIHELGHVWMGQAFGSRGHIVLFGFGGLAVGSNQLGLRWQRILVCFAGPLAGFLFLAIILISLWIWDHEEFPFYLLLIESHLGLPIGTLWDAADVPRMPHHLLFFTIGSLIFINMLWGLINLFPIWPLDGGQISRDVCEGVWRDQGLRYSLTWSMIIAGLLSIHCFMVVLGKEVIPLHIGSIYSAILFGLLAIQSFQLLQQAQQQERWRDDHWDDG